MNYTSGLPSDARVLVTGGSGFIGTNLVSSYRRAGVPVLNLDSAQPRLLADADVWQRVDMNAVAEVGPALSEFRPTHLFHLAARTDLGGRSLDDYALNISGVETLLAALARTREPPSRVVVTSSRMVCRIGYDPRADDDYCPSTAYGASKVETERLVRASTGVPWVIARPTSIWGPWFDVPYRDFFLNVARGRYFHPRGRCVRKSFGFVGNTAWQLHRLMTAPAEQVLERTFYLADYAPIEVLDFANRISTALGRRHPHSVPLPVLSAAARAGDALERTGVRAPITSFRLANLLTPMIHDLAPLLKVTGPLPYDVDAGVAMTVDWMCEQGLFSGKQTSLRHTRPRVLDQHARS